MTDIAVFDLTNEAWAERWLPLVRLASVSMQPGRAHAAAADLGEAETDTLCGDLVDASAHLKALAELCERAALALADANDALHPEGYAPLN